MLTKKIPFEEQDIKLTFWNKIILIWNEILWLDNEILCQNNEIINDIMLLGIWVMGSSVY